MKMLRPIALWLLLLAGIPASFGQGGVEVKLWVQPWHQVEYIFNNERRKVSEVPALRLSEGEHRFVFWAPNHSLLDTLLHVKAGPSMELRKVLKPTPEYLAHRRVHNRVFLKKSAWRGVPLLLTLGCGLKVWGDHRAHDQAWDDLRALQARYAVFASPQQIQRTKQIDLPAAQAQLDQTRQDLQVSLALCGVGVLASVYGFMRAGKLEYPTYEDRERIRFEGLAWLPMHEGGMYVAGMSMPIR